MLLGISDDRRTTTPEAGLLDAGSTDSGKKWVYVQANGAISQYDVVAIDETGQAAAATKALLDVSHKVGVAAAAFADNEYGWVQVYGPCTINVKASCAADAVLYSSATAGHLDDDATSQTKVSGIVLTASRAASDGSAAAFAAVEPFADR